MYRVNFFMNRRGWLILSVTLLIVGVGAYGVLAYVNLSLTYSIGDAIDEFNGVPVFHNGGVQNTAGRNVAADGYNLGIKYQCVEFVKRYYYLRFKHKMPDSYGHAKHFYADNVEDGALNTKRGLLQFVNGSAHPPKSEDILIWGPSWLNPYGHVAILSKVSADQIEVIQQNPGAWANTRETLPLSNRGGRWTIENRRVKAWLRMKQ